MRLVISKRAAEVERLRGEVNSLRDQMEQAPLLRANCERWDYDRDARERIQRSIAQWDSLGEIKRTEDGRIPWTLANNTKAWVSLAELQAAQAELDALLASRGARIHAHAAALKDLAPFLPENWQDPANWPA